MADQYDVPELQGGSGAVNPGAAAYYGFQRELMRRQQDAAAKAEVQRKLAADAVAADVARAQIANSTEATKALSEQRQAATAKTALDNITSQMQPGAQLAPEQSAVLRKNGGAAMILGKPATPEMTAGVPSQFAAAPDAAAASEVPITPAAPATEVYKGDAKQQEDEQQKAFAQDVLDGKHATGNDRVDQFLKAQATQILGGGKFGTIPAAIINEPKAGTEENTPEKRYLGLISKQDSGTALTADEASYVKHYKEQHPDEATKVKAAADAAEAAGVRATDRQNAGYAEAARTKFRTLLNTEDAKSADGLERVARAKAVLNSPSFLADALAAPEVLQIVAGGMGSGLRMTDAELNRVNSAQSYIDQLKGKLAKAGIGERVTIQEELRKSMKTIIDVVEKAKTRLETVRGDFRKQIAGAKTPEQVDALQAEYGAARMEALSGEDKPKGNAPAEGTQGTVNGRPAVWKNGSKGPGWYAR
jgi:hypothetical protein